MYRQPTKRPSNVPMSLNPKRGSQAVIRQGPPSEDTWSFMHPAEYTVVYITNDNATAVRNAPHPSAPPFIWLNSFTLVEFIGTDGFSQLNQFDVQRTAYGDKLWLLVVGEQNCGQKNTWTRIKGQSQVVFPANGKPTPHGTALRVRQTHDQMAPRSTRLAFVAGKTSNNRFLVADPMTPRRYAKVPQSKIIYSRDNARPPTMNTLIRVQYATMQHVEVTRDNAMVVPMQLGYSFPYAMDRITEERYQLISAQTITGSEFARVRDNRWFDETQPLEPQLRFYLDAILAGITLVHTNRVQDTESRCITTIPAWELTEDGHIRMTFAMQYENEKALAKVKQQFKAGGRATIRPEVRPRKQPASVSISDVQIPSPTSIVVEVILDEAAMEAYWEMTPAQLGGVPFTLSVPVNKVAVPAFRTALEQEHMIVMLTKLDTECEIASAKADILRTLMNYPVLQNPSPVLSLGRPLIVSKRGYTLNQGQSDAVHRIMYEQRRVDAIRAFAGSGKTFTAAVAAVLLAQHDDTKRVGVQAPMNHAVSAAATDITLEAVTDTGEALFPMLVLQSQTYLVGKTAHDVYHESRFPVMLTQLNSGKYGPLEEKDAQTVASAVEACIDRFHGLQDVEFGLQAINDDDEGDGGNEEDPLKAALEVLLRVVKPRIVLGTTALFERYSAQLSPYLNVYIGDEAGTLAEHQLFSLVYSYQYARKLALIGDTEQRTNFTADVPRIVEKCGFGPALHKALNSEFTQVTDLNVTFRFHSKLCELISIFYEDLECGISDEQRSRFLRCGFPLPTEGVPIVMQDFYSPSSPAPGGSWTNGLQETTAVQYACIIRRLAPELTIAIVSPYKAACALPRNILGESLKTDPKLTVDNVDCLQGQEFDVVIYMTTRTLALAERENREEAERCMHFVGEKARTVVGLTREKEGLIVIGHFGSLRFSEVWRRVLEKAESLTQTVPYEFVDQIDVEALLADQRSPASHAAEALGGLELLSPPTAAPDLDTTNDEHTEAPISGSLPAPPIAPILPTANSTRVSTDDESEPAPDEHEQPILVNFIPPVPGTGIGGALPQSRPVAVIRPESGLDNHDDTDQDMELVTEILSNARQPREPTPSSSSAAAGTEGSTTYADAAAAAVTKPMKSTPKKAVRPRRK